MSRYGGAARPLPLLAAALCAMLAACSGGGDKVAHMVDMNAAAARAQDDIAQYAAVTNAAPVAKPVRVKRVAVDDSSPSAAAAALVGRYFAAIGAGQYDTAWRMWGQDGAGSGMSAKAFAESYAKYATYTAEVGAPGEPDAGAGQIYVTVPVRVTGTLRQGGSFAMEGPVVLHRVNDGIETSDPTAHQWRIQSSELKPRP